MARAGLINYGYVNIASFSAEDKASPVAGDKVIILDSADSDSIKTALISSLPGGGGGSTTSIQGTVAAYNDLLSGSPLADVVGALWAVTNSTGVLWAQRSGVYQKISNTVWNRLSNATFEVLDTEAKFTDESNGFSMTFQLSELTADIVLEPQNKSYTIADHAEVSLNTSSRDLLKVSSNDTTPDYLENKVTSGRGLSKVINNEAGNENVELLLDSPYTTVLSSSLYSGCLLSNGTGNTFTLASGIGIVLDSSTYPTIITTSLTITQKTNVTLTNIATSPVTYILITSGDAILQQTTFPTNHERRDNIFIGVVVHSDNATINAFNYNPDVGIDVTGQLRDVINVLGFLNLSGNVITPNGANLSLDKSAGIVFKSGVNAETSFQNPHELSLISKVLATFRYRNQDSSEGSDVTLIDPTTYDVGGVTTAIAGSNNQATIQKIYIFSSNTIRVQRGQTVYPTLNDAISNIGLETFVVEPNIDENGLLLSTLAVTKGCTDLSVITEARFFQSAKFGDLGGVGISVSNLQNVYDNSVTPETTTDSTRGAVSYKRGSALDSDDVIEVLNGAGTQVFNVTGEGHLDAVTAGFGANPNALDTVDIDGSLLLEHTALATDDHAMEIDTDASGFGDVKALDINYVTGALATGSDEAIILVNIDESLATGGDVTGLEVISTEGSADKVIGLLVSAGIDPIKQLSGAFADADTVDDNGVDETTALSGGGAGNVAVFTNDNEYMIIGLATKFEEIEFLLATVASQSGIQPTFEFSTGIGTWSLFTPVDGTNGMRNNGVIVWLDSDISTWATGAGTEYLIRITRTRNSLNTSPIANKVQVVQAFEYQWDKNGDISAKSISVTGDVVTGGLVDGIDLQTQATAIALNTGKTTNASHTGDATGATVLTISNNAVNNVKLSDMTVNTIKGRVTAGTGDPEDLTATQARTILNVADGSTANLGDVVGPASATDNFVTLYDGTTGKLVKNSTINGAWFNQSLLTTDDVDFAKTTVTDATTAVMEMVSTASGSALFQCGVEFDFRYSKTTGPTIIDFEPRPLDGTSDSQVRFFLSSGSTGQNKVLIFDPNGANIQHEINSSGSSSYLCRQGGRLGIGTGSPDGGAILDLVSTTGALLLPRMTTTQRNAITAVNGMMIYDITLNQTQTYENGAWRAV